MTSLFDYIFVKQQKPTIVKLIRKVTVSHGRHLKSGINNLLDIEDNLNFTLNMKQKIVVFTGAGISKESGIPTFRDANGMWNKYDAKKLASVAGFEENPQAVLDFYNARRKNLLDVEPNHAHYVLAELEKQHDVTIVTQNVDNLGID